MSASICAHCSWKAGYRGRAACFGWLAVTVIWLGLFVSSTRAEIVAEVWVTTEDLTKQLNRDRPALFTKDSRTTGDNGATDVAMLVRAERTHQVMLGFGSSFEHSTCHNLSRLGQKDRAETIARLVDRQAGIGMNLMRICMGTPDFTGDPWYSYDDLPAGQTDPEMKHFSIDRDRRYIIPVLKTALDKNPQLLFFASPWSPPGWMKSSRTMVGGRLLPEHYAAYATYFVKFVQAYEREGIPIYAVTIQNEPGIDRQHDAPKWRYPSCRWTGEQERDFIRDHLGPAFKNNGIATKIWCYDHNYNVAPGPDGNDPGIAYPREILSDARAAQFVSGVAFHGYVGEPDGMSRILKEFPAKQIHFTEGSVFGLAGAQRLIELLSHGAASYNAWVTMIDDNGKPNNGPFPVSPTCILLDTKETTVDYRLDYYLYGQFMKFIERGAIRIDVTGQDAECPAIGFKNPDGKLALILVNLRGTNRSIELVSDGTTACLDLAARSVMTIVWRPESN
jgi:glucosylceramidase